MKILKKHLNIKMTSINQFGLLVATDWAYDIGYGGLDHVLASGANVNILV